MANRHLSRSVVMQTLFEWDFGSKDVSPSDIENILLRNAEEFAPGMGDTSFMRSLVENVLKKRETLDGILTKAAPDWPIEKLCGTVVYAKDKDEVYLALVHDIFGHWTLSKGHIEAGDTEEVGVVKETLEELGINIIIKEKLGENEYVASDPEKGKIRKHVVYFLTETPFSDLKLKKSGGLDDARWFRLADILDLNIYDDILPIFRI